MQDTPIEPMSAENAEEFEVLIFESRNLEVSVISLRGPMEVRNGELPDQPVVNIHREH
jgi:hypothetical protein